MTLMAGGKHEFSVKSNNPVWLGLSTNASFEAMQKYKSSDPLPVRLTHRLMKQEVSTIKGAGRVAFTPVDGSIPLVLVNETDEDLLILVYSSNSDGK